MASACSSAFKRNRERSHARMAVMHLRCFLQRSNQIRCFLQLQTVRQCLPRHRIARGTEQTGQVCYAGVWLCGCVVGKSSHSLHDGRQRDSSNSHSPHWTCLRFPSQSGSPSSRNYPHPSVTRERSRRPNARKQDLVECTSGLHHRASLRVSLCGHQRRRQPRSPSPSRWKLEMSQISKFTHFSHMVQVPTLRVSTPLPRLPGVGVLCGHISSKGVYASFHPPCQVVPRATP
jgi:hypothetical protein